MKKITVFENVNLSAPDVDDYDDNDDDEADDENRAGKRYEIALVMRRVTIFTIPEWFLARQLFVYSITLRSETNRLLAFWTFWRHFYGL